MALTVDIIYNDSDVSNLFERGKLAFSNFDNFKDCEQFLF